MEVIERKIKVEKFIKILEDTFESNGFDEYELTFSQIGKTTMYFISINNTETNMKVDTSNINFPIRKNIAKAINIYKKQAVIKQRLLDLRDFNDRDELTKFNLID